MKYCNIKNIPKYEAINTPTKGIKSNTKPISAATTPPNNQSITAENHFVSSTYLYAAIPITNIADIAINIGINSDVAVV